MFIFRFGIYKRLSIVSLIFCIANMVVILLQWTHPIGMSEFQAQCPLLIPSGSVEVYYFNSRSDYELTNA